MGKKLEHSGILHDFCNTFQPNNEPFFEFKLHGQFFRMQNDVALTIKFEIKKRLVLGMKQKILNNFKTTSQHLTQDW